MLRGNADVTGLRESRGGEHIVHKGNRRQGLILGRADRIS